MPNNRLIIVGLCLPYFCQIERRQCNWSGAFPDIELLRILTKLFQTFLTFSQEHPRSPSDAFGTIFYWSSRFCKATYETNELRKANLFVWKTQLYCNRTARFNEKHCFIRIKQIWSRRHVEKQDGPAELWIHHGDRNHCTKMAQGTSGTEKLGKAEAIHVPYFSYTHQSPLTQALVV